jgi:hypothetical protein
MRARPAAALAALILASVEAHAGGLCGEAVAVPAAEVRALAPFIARLQLRYARAAIGTISHVNAEGRLPDCYLTRHNAAARGWRPGSDLWQFAPGAALGGDTFANRERRLPAARDYVEADLDYAGGRRGPVRLVFERDGKGRWAQWVTTDHYRTFHKVPARQ